MADFSEIPLWRSALGSQDEAATQSAPRDRLRAGLLSFRANASLLASEIGGDLKQFTVHDISHLDALWEMADQIAGSHYKLTATEAYVLGGAILVHDLGLALAAYAAGETELRQHDLWRDTAALLLARRLGRAPQESELTTIDIDIAKQATEQALRTLHAEHAERLATVGWQSSNGPLHLIADEQLRIELGPLIGRIAHSHWWSISEVASEFRERIGAPVWCPAEWQVDPLKLACLLRTADASHLDARRAPRLLRALRKPQRASDAHWVFQGRLQKPQRAEDRLRYTTTSGFPPSEAAAWWLCHDALVMVDSELRSVDAVLADTGRERLAAKSVAGVEDPALLASLIPTPGWLPVNVRPRISDVAGVVARLGGVELYGDDPLVPLRELIQNASDAVRARRILERRESLWGRIVIRRGIDSRGEWLEVEDSGTGMSVNVLTGPLVDFGASLWGSTAMADEYPGLASAGFAATGHYGIGFYSVFMWGDRVTVTTRRFDAAQRDTLVLTFENALAEPPLLRKAERSEYLVDGGTRIRVWFKQGAGAAGGLLRNRGQDERSLAEVCRDLCPLLDIQIVTDDSICATSSTLDSIDWASSDAGNLLGRLSQIGLNSAQTTVTVERDLLLEALSANVRPLREAQGRVVGRACIAPDRRYASRRTTGIVAIGNMRSGNLTGLAGVLLGAPTRAARDAVMPIAAPPVLGIWATEQSGLVRNLGVSDLEMHDCAGTIYRLGGDVGDLPIAYGRHGWLSAADIRQRVAELDRVVLISDTELRVHHDFDAVEVADGVLAVEKGVPSIFNPLRPMWSPDRPLDKYSWDVAFWPSIHGHRTMPQGLMPSSLETLVCRCVATAWGVDFEAVLEASVFTTDDIEYSIIAGTEGERALSTRCDVLYRPGTGRTQDSDDEVRKLVKADLRRPRRRK